MAFKISTSQAIVYQNPEALLDDIKQKQVKGLLSHQAAIINNYLAKAADKPDVSIQLATGAGKTLIGILLAEWLRRTHSARVLYLCPTNQLVNQVVIQSQTQYGIDVLGFVGPKSEYQASSKAAYLASERVAVSSYSALFNTNPFFEDPQYIILDDVHQAEGYINSLWSMKIQRHIPDHEDLFEHLLALLQGAIPQSDFERIIGNEQDSVFVDKLPTPVFDTNRSAIVRTIDEYVETTDQKFAWKMIKSHLHACHFYYSVNEILIKPLYAPTEGFMPFSGATQRIYMSATLGNGGDICRIVGRRTVHNLEIPEQWRERSVGRRLFLFPELSLNEDDGFEFLLESLEKVDRSVYIVPSKRTLNDVCAILSENADQTIFSISDIEQSKAQFIKSTGSVLVLANRYDGIDFPDSECRQLIIDGIPRASNLQEAFFISKLALGTAFQSRIITRIVQAFGRTTRNVNDYSIVIVFGDELVNYLFKQDSRKFLLPELRAEIEFGMEQSRSTTKADLIENAGIFLQQGDDWKPADARILTLRDNFVRADFPANSELFSIVEHEVRYSEQLWVGNFSGAFDECRHILGKLVSPDLRGLRGLWNYFAGSTLYFMQKEGTSTPANPEFYFSEASKATPAVSWMHRLKHSSRDTTPQTQSDELASMVERIEEKFAKLGNRNTFRLEKELSEIKQLLSVDDSGCFEKGQTLLGQLIGFDAGKIEIEGSPDPWWIVNERQCFIFEDYTEGKTSSSLSVTKARQAFSHKIWAKKHLKLREDAQIYVIIVGKIHRSSPAALTYVSEVGFWRSDDFREWASWALDVIRELWTQFPNTGDLFWRQLAIDRLRQSGISPEFIVELFNANRASDILK